MEIRRMVRGENVNFSSSLPRTREEKTKQPAAAPSTDRLELSRQWIQSMEEQRAQAGAALLTGAREEKKSNSILDMLDAPSAEQEELDALSQEMDTQMKCLKIAMRIMQGKKVPPEDERFLMENDPDGYKLALAMRKPPKKDEEECESVLKDEDKEEKESSKASGSEAAAPTEGGGTASAGGETE